MGTALPRPQDKTSAYLMGVLYDLLIVVTT
jgi:hypothetical protein